MKFGQKHIYGYSYFFFLFGPKLLHHRVCIRLFSCHVLDVFVNQTFFFFFWDFIGKKGISILPRGQGNPMQRLWHSNPQSQWAHTEAQQVSPHRSEALCLLYFVPKPRLRRHCRRDIELGCGGGGDEGIAINEWKWLILNKQHLGVFDGDTAGLACGGFSWPFLICLQWFL